MGNSKAGGTIAAAPVARSRESSKGGLIRQRGLAALAAVQSMPGLNGAPESDAVVRGALSEMRLLLIGLNEENAMVWRDDWITSLAWLAGWFANRPAAALQIERAILAARGAGAVPATFSPWNRDRYADSDDGPPASVSGATAFGCARQILADVYRTIFSRGQPSEPAFMTFHTNANGGELGRLAASIEIEATLLFPSPISMRRGPGRPPDDDIKRRNQIVRRLAKENGLAGSPSKVTDLANANAECVRLNGGRPLTVNTVKRVLKPAKRATIRGANWHSCAPSTPL